MLENRTYTALLRGINVGGKNIIYMEKLNEMFVQLGFHDVFIYLQSGNVIFKSDDFRIEELQLMISEKIRFNFGYDIHVLVFSQEELSAIFNECPFKENEHNTSEIYFTFLNQEIPEQIFQQIIKETNSSDLCSSGKKVIYIRCTNGYGKTKFTNLFFEKKLKTIATTRNWKTVTELIKKTNQSNIG